MNLSQTRTQRNCRFEGCREPVEGHGCTHYCARHGVQAARRILLEKRKRFRVLLKGDPNCERVIEQVIDSPDEIKYYIIARKIKHKRLSDLAASLNYFEKYTIKPDMVELSHSISVAFTIKRLNRNIIARFGKMPVYLASDGRITVRLSTGMRIDAEHSWAWLMYERGEDNFLKKRRQSKAAYHKLLSKIYKP